MQKIERYGVIALVFMAVSVVAVYLWDDRGHGIQEREAPQAQHRAAAEPRSGRGAPRSSQARPPADARAAAQRRRVDLPMNVDQRGGARQLPQAAPRNSVEMGTAATPNQVPRAMPGSLNRTTAAVERPHSEQGVAAQAAPAAHRNSNRQSRPLERSAASEHEALSSAAAARADPERSAQPAASTRRYTVRERDSLERIARSQLGDASLWPRIQSINGIRDPRRIRVGQVLLLPSAGAGEATNERVAQAPTESQTAPGGESEPSAAVHTYVIKKGDVLGTIAQEQLGSVKQLPKILELNPGLNPDRILVGMKIALPAAAQGGSRPKRQSTPVEIADPDRRVAQAEPARANSGSSRYKVR